jgi:ABC-2 type transport system permease protein
LHYPRRLQANVLIIVFRVMMMLVVYGYAFEYIGRPINGIDAKTAVWSIAIYFILIYSQFRGIFDVINSEIRNGQLETQLNKPYNYLAYKFWERLGRGTLNLIIQLVAVVPLLFLLTGGLPEHFSPGRVLLAMILFVGGMLVSAAIYMLISLPALWIDDATPFYWIVDKAIMILGGAYIPLALLPSYFQNISTFTPFGAPMFATQMFNPYFLSRLPQFLLMQIFWILVLGLAVRFMFNRSRKKLSINGG